MNRFSLKSKGSLKMPVPLSLAAICSALLLTALSGAYAVQVTYQVNMAAQIALGNFHPGADSVFVSGDFSNPSWISGSGAAPYTLSPAPGNTNLYSGTFSVVNPAGTYENHKFVINTGNSFISLNWEQVTGGGNRYFVVGTSNLTLAAVNFSDVPMPQALSFAAGADFSLLAFFENLGVVYADAGQVQDGLAILKHHGLSCARLRLFTSSAAQAQADPYDYTNNLAYTLPLAVRVKNAGLQFMLDFHYSDTWADPAHQAIPAAWTNLTFTQLVQQMRSYNSNCIASFKAAGAMPDFVQVGNEITAGMLWPYGQVGTTTNSTQWSQLAQLMNAAIQGISDASGATPPKIVVHIDRGGDWGGTQWFFDNLVQQGVSFDIIGESYYPFWHGPLTNLAQCLTNAARRYGKPVFIAETAFPWTNSYMATNIVGIAPSAQGQVQYVVALAQVIKNVPAQLGAGVFYWGAEYQTVAHVNEAGFNTTSFFDTAGNLLPVADALGQLAAPLTLSAGLNGSSLNLNWPLSGAGASVMTTTSLAPLAVWAPLTNAVQTNGTVFQLSVPRDADSARFYRLRSD
jgi:arabinogalactan endo-1,4-beta-galactosidase